jgi:hypothetical protein
VSTPSTVRHVETMSEVVAGGEAKQGEVPQVHMRLPMYQRPSTRPVVSFDPTPLRKGHNEGSANAESLHSTTLHDECNVAIAVGPTSP